MWPQRTIKGADKLSAEPSFAPCPGVSPNLRVKCVPPVCMTVG